jgi:hypothetical protein
MAKLPVAFRNIVKAPSIMAAKSDREFSPHSDSVTLRISTPRASPRTLQKMQHRAIHRRRL